MPLLLLLRSNVTAAAPGGGGSPSDPYGIETTLTWANLLREAKLPTEPKKTVRRRLRPRI